MIYLFEGRSLDTDRRELRRGADPIAVQPQVFDLVLHLIRHRQRVVTKDELITAVWKGRIVSESTIGSRIAAARDAVGDTGKHQHLIRTLPRVGLRFIGQVYEQATSGGADAAPAACGVPAKEHEHSSVPAQNAPSVIGKSSIAVDPFLDISGGTERRHFISGILEDITTALSQYPWLAVVERTSDQVSQEWALDIAPFKPAFTVNYLLKGSLRVAEHRVRVTARLVDAATGTLLWARRFDVWHEDVLALQDQITGSVVRAIGPRLEQLEIDRARREPSARLDALGCYLLGMGRLYRWNREGISEAFSLFQRAAELDPEFASAYGMAAYCYVQRKSYGWMSDRDQEATECASLAQQAAACAGDDAVALTKAAHAISSVVCDIDGGADFVDQALKLNPSLAAGWYVSGWIRLFLGEPDVAIEHLGRAITLGQFDPLSFKMHAALGYAHFLSGRYDEAAAWAERALHARPHYLTGMRLAAAAHACAGRLPHAQGLIAQVHGLHPELRVADLAHLIPFQRRVDVERWTEALSRAGLPG
ncbi:MAG TPA: winged helix-turn-helix domain-containing protein [Geminicoccaceae bacterium]